MINTRHWLPALLLALTLHLAGFALVMAQSSNVDGARDQGEQGIEIDLGMLGELGVEAATLEAAPAEPGPEPEPEPVVEPEPVMPRQQAQVRTEPTPESRPTPKPDPRPQPKAEPRPVAVDEDSDSRATQSSRKATSGSSDAATAGGNPGAQRSYFAQLAAHLAKHKRYPAASRRRGEEGIVKLLFELDRHGRLLSYRITQSSGYERLDRAVIRMLESAGPLPAFPPEMDQPRLSVNIPVAFAINDRR